MQQVICPYQSFNGLNGLPLALGNIYIGVENQDPQTNPITVYFDSAATQVATQPIRTIGGYPNQNGSPAQLWVAGRFSIRVRDQQGNQVFYVASTGPIGNPYHIHAEFLGSAPAAQQIVAIHVFGIAVTLGANLAGAVWAFTNTAPSSNCNFDIRANGVSFGTLTIDTSGVVSVTSTAQNFSVGDRLTIHTPSGGTTIQDFGITIAGTLS